ncbi:MAG: 16S rRNA (cytidine(1402)-2'-O)-methyltransferase [Elusimicrobia bacterium]|nr:16S rRNA (cytidine(1402)-2'-O)-methyltransferase [Elusimicrobiota bacterium]MBD3411636.1 16S rRNA (cytidine(1402)-2'-O)-methyltransferase [Elusimicrobiota bacterium]
MVTLYVVATPIGHLDDISARALNILRTVDAIACEDSRRTQKLLSHYDIHTRLISYHAYSTDKRLRYILELLTSNRSIALVSDSGTPAVSDPGYVLIQAAIQNRIPVESIPGPSAVIAAAACSGLPVDRFVFLGFLPRRPGRATEILKNAAGLKQTIIFFESPFRIHKTIGLLKKIFDASAYAVVARELTKKFEQIIRGSLDDIEQKLADQEIRGEIVVLVDARDTSTHGPDKHS